MTVSAIQELQERIEGIEESYEYMLAYAAQGLTTHEATSSGAQLKEYLLRTERALRELADLFVAAIGEIGPEPRDAHLDFVEVLREDARKAGAALRLTAAQPRISSQLVDNLNASIHLRALLTDVFLLDEIITPRATVSAASSG